MTGAGGDEAPGDPAATGGDPQSDGSGSPAPARRRLSLGDPLPRRAAEDRPEAWGDRDSERDRAADYVRERPPHHGG